MAHDWTTYKSEADLRAALVANARTYLGTRYRHQGHERAGGVDCLGLVIASGRDFGFDFTITDDDKNYSMNPDGYYFVERLRAEMFELENWREAQPGDVVVMRWHVARPPQHVGIVTRLETDNCVCVHSSRVERQVVETRWDREDLITNAFSFIEGRVAISPN